MESYLKLSSLSPSSLGVSEILSNRLVFKQSLPSSPIYGRCISEIKISSEKSSPLPTPIALNFLKPKTPTSISVPSFCFKKTKSIEIKSLKIEDSAKELKLERPKKVGKKGKKEPKFEAEQKIDVKEKNREVIQKLKFLKQLGNNFRKMNLKFSKKRFVQKATWGTHTGQPIKALIIEEYKKSKQVSKTPKALKPTKTAAAKTKVAKSKDKKSKKNLKKPQKKKLVFSKPVSPLSKYRPRPVLEKIIKIQSFFRGYLIRKRIKYLKEPKLSVEFSNHFSAFHSSSQSHMQEDIEVQNILKQKIESSFSNLPSLCPSQCKPTGLKEADVISAEIDLRMRQNSRLKELQRHDMEEMRLIAEKYENKSELVEIFTSFIQRRYEKLGDFFEKSIEKLKKQINSLDRTGGQKIRILELEAAEGIEFDLETMLQEIEKIEEDRNNSFLYDPQPLPPLSPISENRKVEIIESIEVDLSEYDLEGINSFSEKPIFPDCPVSVTSYSADFEPVFSVFKQRSAVVLSISSLATADTTETLTPSQIDSEHDQRLKFRYPVSSTQSSVRTEDPNTQSEDLSISLISNQVVSQLEYYIYQSSIADLLEDELFLLSTCESFIYSLIEKYIIEYLNSPKSYPPIQSDSASLLSLIDKQFLISIKSPEKTRETLTDILHPLTLLSNLRTSKKIDFKSVSLFTPTFQDKYFSIHTKAVFSACSEALLSLILSKKQTNFDFCETQINTLNLSDYLISARDSVFSWNEIKSGNIPPADYTEDDEEILQVSRTQSLAKFLYNDLSEDDKQWSDYFSDEEELILSLEQKILKFLIKEAISLI